MDTAWTVAAVNVDVVKDILRTGDLETLGFVDAVLSSRRKALDWVIKYVNETSQDTEGFSPLSLANDAFKPGPVPGTLTLWDEFSETLFVIQEKTVNY